MTLKMEESRLENTQEFQFGVVHAVIVKHLQLVKYFYIKVHERTQ